MTTLALILLVIAAIFIVQSIKVVPQQHAWVVERLGKYNGTLTPATRTSLLSITQNNTYLS